AVFGDAKGHLPDGFSQTTFEMLMKRWLLSSVAMCVLALATPAAGGQADGRLDIYWVDVEGGAATLVVTPRGQSLLVDTGNPGHRDPDRIVKVAAEVAGLRQ